MKIIGRGGAMSYLCHYGMPRRSGRYPWGSGERPFQGEKNYGSYKIKKYKNKNVEQAKKIFARTALSMIPGYSVVSGIRLSKTVASSLTQTDYQKIEGPLEKISLLKRKRRTYTTEQDLQIVNTSKKEKKKGVQKIV